MKFFHQYHSSPQIIHNNKINFEPHLHEAVEIIALYKGETSLSVDGCDYKMCSGDFLIIFPNTIHSFTCDGEVEVGKFIFSPQTVSQLKSVFDSNIPKNPIINADAAKLAGLDTLSKEILKVYQDSSIAVKNAYLFLFAAKIIDACDLQKRNTAENGLIGQLFDYCQKNYKERITQKDVASALHISNSYLSHIFMYKLKINFCNYINILRVNEACSLLSNSQKSIIEIAEESGFGSLRSFNRAFIRHTGSTPKDYRKALR